jgi:hypothetical protein
VSNDLHTEIFADELGGILLSYPISKLTFVTAQQIGSGGDVEKIKVLTLTLSTQNLINACKLVLANARENQELILSSASVSEKKLLTLLQSETVATSNTSAPVAKKQPKTTKAKK